MPPGCLHMPAGQSAPDRPDKVLREAKVVQRRALARREDFALQVASRLRSFRIRGFATCVGFWCHRSRGHAAMQNLIQYTTQLPSTCGTCLLLYTSKCQPLAVMSSLRIGWNLSVVATKRQSRRNEERAFSAGDTFCLLHRLWSSI